MARVESYTADAIDSLLNTQAAFNADTFATKDAVSSGLDASMASGGQVPVADGDGDWAWGVVSGSGGGGTSSYLGEWSDTDSYEIGDQVSYEGILWHARIANTATAPAISTFASIGGNGGPGSSAWSAVVGNNPNMILQPLHVNASKSLASVSVYVQSGGLPEMDVFIVATRPTIGGSSAVTPVLEPTHIAARPGTGWHEIYFDEPLDVTSSFDYWVFFGVASGGLGNLATGPTASYSGSMVAPTQNKPVYRLTSGSNWAEFTTNLFIKLGEGESAPWKALADLSGSSSSGAVDSVNGQTGAVVLDAEDVSAIPAGEITAIDVITQAAYDALSTKVATTLYIIQG